MRANVPGENVLRGTNVLGVAINYPRGSQSPTLIHLLQYTDWGNCGNWAFYAFQSDDKVPKEKRWTLKFCQAWNSLLCAVCHHIQIILSLHASSFNSISDSHQSLALAILYWPLSFTTKWLSASKRVAIHIFQFRRSVNICILRWWWWLSPIPLIRTQGMIMLKT